MSIEDYFGKNTGSYPAPGCAGIESEWFEAGTISIPTGELWVGSSFQTMREEGCVVKVARGIHHVSVKGMDFDGHRRMARGRVCLDSAKKPIIGNKACGKISVDGGMVAFCDVVRYDQVVFPRFAKQFLKDYGQASMTAFFETFGIKSMSFKYGNKSVDVAFMPSGLGDGSYKVYPIQSGEQVVGAEVEFLASNFKARVSL